MSAPKTLGRYQLVEKLAVGGMAEIYVARAQSPYGFEKEYVLKLIHPKHGDDEEFMRMLVDEAKLTAQLTHTNIAQVIDLGVHDDTYFIVMEYVRGRDLHQILNQAYDADIPVPLDVCAFIGKEMAAGLFYAHTKVHETTGKPLNLVHRDISPQNVLVSWDGEVKIVDFGVAKAALAARPETQAGVIKGKFRYMSPEQAWGEKLDGRSDLFSAGLCLYEMATSSMAYDDDPDMRNMLVKMREAKFTPPSELRPEINEHFERIIMTALKRRRHERFSTAEDFEAALNGYLASENPSFTRARVREFLAEIFPDEAPYHASATTLTRSPTKRSGVQDVITEPLSASDVVETTDLASLKDRAIPTPKADSTDEIDTADRTSQNMKTAGDSLEGEFDDEKTELFNGDNAEEYTAPMTAQMDAGMVKGLQHKSGLQPQPDVSPLVRAQRTPSGPQPNLYGSVPPGFKPSVPSEVPNAWLPKEFDGTTSERVRPTARSVFSEIMESPEKRAVILPYIILGVAGMILIGFVMALFIF